MEKRMEKENIEVVVGLTLFTIHYSPIRRQETGDRSHESRVTTVLSP